MRLLGNSSPTLPPPMASKLLVFTAITVARLLVSKAITKMGGKDIIRKTENITRLTVFIKIQLLLLSKHALVCYKSLVNFQSSKKFILTVFTVFSFLLWRNRFSEALTLPFPKLDLVDSDSKFLLTRKENYRNNIPYIIE